MTIPLTDNNAICQSIQLFVDIAAYPDLIVLDFEGSVGLSKLYEFKINILSKQLIDDDKLLDGAASLTCQMGSLKHTISGMIYDWQITDDNIKLDKFFSYSFTLVPLAQKLQHNKRIATYLNKSLPDIISELLNQQQLSFRFDLQKNYSEKNFVFQYQESDWHFITRWLERLGMFYYFEHHPNETTLVITDSNTTLSKDASLTNLNYQNYSQDPPLASEARLWQFSSKKKRGPKNLKLVAYDPDKASQQISIDISVDPNGQGEIEIWQEDLLSPKEIAAYALVLKNTYLWQTQVFSGSAEQRLLPGTFIQIDNTYQAAWNKKNYLVLNCLYSGTQRSAILNTLLNTDKNADDPRIFRCDFEAIPLTQAFCAPCTTKAPVIGGVIPAFIIDSTDSGINIPINSSGCYQVAFSAKADAKTFWLRMCQPYTGDNYGSMAPLYAGTEVMLSFLYGNPDLPIIINAVFNSTHQSLFSQDSSQQSGIVSANNSQIVLTDSSDGNNILLSSPDHGSFISIGSIQPLRTQIKYQGMMAAYDAACSSYYDTYSDPANLITFNGENSVTYTNGFYTSICNGGGMDIYGFTYSMICLLGTCFVTTGVAFAATAGVTVNLTAAGTIDYEKTWVIRAVPAEVSDCETLSATSVGGTSTLVITPATTTLITPSVIVEAPLVTITALSTTVVISSTGVEVVTAGTVGVTAATASITATSTSITGNVDITGMVSVTGSLDVVGPVGITGNLDVTGNITEVGMFSVAGSSIFS